MRMRSLNDPDTGKISHFANLERQPPPYSGISVNRDGNELLITDERDAGSPIPVVGDCPGRFIRR
jgi:hypothetical protein